MGAAFQECGEAGREMKVGEERKKKKGSCSKGVRLMSRHSGRERMSNQDDRWLGEHRAEEGKISGDNSSRH